MRDDENRNQVFQCFGAKARKLTHQQTIDATRDERIQSIWWFLVREVNKFHKTLRPRERANFDAEDVLLDLWPIVAEKDRLWNPDVSTYITFVGVIVSHALEEIRGRSRTVQSPRNAVSRLRSYGKADEAGELTDKTSATATAIRRTLAEPVPIDHHDDNPESSPDEIVSGMEEMAITAASVNRASRNLADSRQSLIIAMIFGFDGRESTPTKEIASRLGMTHANVIAIRDAAFEEIRRMLSPTPQESPQEEEPDVE